MGAHLYPDQGPSVNGPEGAGGTPFVFDLGTMAYSIVLVSVTVRIVAETHRHSALFRWCIALSTLSWVPSNFILDVLRQDGMEGRMRLVFGSALFWLLLLAAAGLFVVRISAWKAALRLWQPDLRHVVCEVNARVSRDGDRSALWYVELADTARKLGKPIKDVANDMEFTATPPMVRVVGGATASDGAGEASHPRLPLLAGGSGGGPAGAAGFASSSPMRELAPSALSLLEAPYAKLGSPATTRKPQGNADSEAEPAKAKEPVQLLGKPLKPFVVVAGSPKDTDKLVSAELGADNKKLVADA